MYKNPPESFCCIKTLACKMKFFFLRDWSLSIWYQLCSRSLVGAGERLLLAFSAFLSKGKWMDVSKLRAEKNSFKAFFTYDNRYIYRSMNTHSCVSFIFAWTLNVHPLKVNVYSPHRCPASIHFWSPSCYPVVFVGAWCPVYVYNLSLTDVWLKLLFDFLSFLHST